MVKTPKCPKTVRIGRGGGRIYFWTNQKHIKGKKLSSGGNVKTIVHECILSQVNIYVHSIDGTTLEILQCISVETF